MPPLPGLRVGHSGIHGYGVFTTRTFATGEVVVIADGVIYDEHADFDDTYALVLPRDDDDDSAGLVFLDLADQSRWINHSCDPNLEVESTFDRATGELRAWWVARREIAIGEELTYDYAFIGDAAERCGCGAPTCRGLIVDPDPAELAKVDPALLVHLRISRAA
jgi:uncharacterized protein